MDIEEIEFHKLKGKYRHYCADWDFMAIDETCPEFESCRCRKFNFARDALIFDIEDY